MNKTKIEWVINPDGSPGYTWNPVIGCKHGCSYCYAKRMNDRYQWIEEWDQPLVRPLRGQKLSKFHRPKTIFVGSMTDLFGDWVDDLIIECVLRWTREYPAHTFLFLTKNPKRYFDFKFPDNCWLGSTVTGGKDRFYMDADDSCFISYEPLLGEIEKCVLIGVKWIIIGSLNLNGRPISPDQGGTKLEWVYGLLSIAAIFNVPVFVKDSLLKLHPHLPRFRQLPYLEKNKA